MKLNRISSPWIPSNLAMHTSVAMLLLVQAVHGQTIPNPSFEADTFTVFPGYITNNTAITGWIGTPTSRVGLNPASGSPFADNGTIPNGNNVAFIQVNPDDPASPSTLSTTISGLTAGTTYKVTFRANARGGNTPNVKIYIDGVAVLLPGVDGFSTAAVTGSKGYWHVAFEFTAAAESQALSLVNDATGDQTLLVDDFQIAPTSGKWAVESWAGDFDSGVDSQFLYTHAYNFGSSANTTINGVPFTGVGGGNPAVSGKFTTGYLVNVYGGDVNALTYNFDGSSTMATDFIYGGPGGNVPADSYQTIALEGLTPGTEYVLTIYSVGWEDPSVGSRWATFSVGNDSLTINQDQFGNDGGIRVSYRYTADASGTVAIKYAPLVPANVSIHTYGFSNRKAVSSFELPTINVQPKSVIVSPDVAVSFNVVAAGVPPPAYQWRFNGAVIDNATDTAFPLFAVSTADAGSYDVVVSNVAGAVTSAVARLTVGLPITNPSFEQDGFYGWPGYVSGNYPITGWASPPNHGINPVLGNPPNGPNPFADNGAIPHGSQVAFLQGDGTNSQVVSGFTVGAQYYVHYFENSRSVVTIPGMEVKVGGGTVAPVHSVNPVGGGNSYREIFSQVFAASATDLELAFVKSSPSGGDCTALIDNVAIVEVPAGTPPAVVTQPQPMTVYLGEPAWFAAVAQGSLPLDHQWYLDGAPVSGAISNVLILPSVQLADEGDYTLVVTNSFGSVTSVVARLSLLEKVPSLHSSGIDAGGNPLAGGAIDPSWSLVANPDGGSTNVYVANEGWPIQADTWIPNSASSKWVGSRASVGDAGIPGGDYRYRTTFDLTGRDTNTVIIIGRWLSDNWGTPVLLNGTEVSVPPSFNFNAWTSFTLDSANATFLPGINTLDFVVNNAAAGASGLRVEFTQVSARTLPGVVPAIVVHPQGSTVAEGDTVVMGVSATGTLPLTYQWKKNDLDLGGKTGATLTLTGVTTNDSGLYCVAVSNAWGGVVSSNAALVVAYRPIPGIFGTGLDASGALLPDGAVDPHYILASSADTNYPGPEALVITNVWPIQAGVWLPNGPYSRWIGPSSAQRQDLDPTQGNAAGAYTYQTTFNLTGYDLSRIHLTGGAAADNSITDVLINGVSTGFAVAGFSALTPFTIPGTMLLAGVNTVDVIVTNDPTAGDPTAPNPAGLRVDLKGYLNILPAPPTLTIARDGNNVTISWSPTATGQVLQWAEDLTGPWTDIVNPPNPYTTTASETRRFYRIAQ